MGQICGNLPGTANLRMHGKVKFYQFKHTPRIWLKVAQKIIPSGSGQNTDFASKGDGLEAPFFERILYFGYPEKHMT